MKTVLISILAVLSTVLVGVSAYQRSNQLEITSIVVNQPIINQSANNQPQENKQCTAEGEKDYIYEYKPYISE